MEIKYLAIFTDSLFENSKDGLGSTDLKCRTNAFSSLSKIAKAGIQVFLLPSDNHEQPPLKNALNIFLNIAKSEGITLDTKLIQTIKSSNGLTSDFLLLLKDKSVDHTSSNVYGGNKVGQELAKKLGSCWIDDSQSLIELATDIVSRDRIATIKRKTKETDIAITVNLDGTGNYSISTGLEFYNHMLENMSRHSGVDMKIKVTGDLEVDEHHTIEDTAIAIGQALKKAAGDKRGIGRYGFVLPMDETLATCALDFSGRNHLTYDVHYTREKIGDVPTEMIKHFFISLCEHAGFNLNLKTTGENDHHIMEASFKSLAKCMKQAFAKSGSDLPSTKGIL